MIGRGGGRPEEGGKVGMGSSIPISSVRSRTWLVGVGHVVQSCMLQGLFPSFLMRGFRRKVVESVRILVLRSSWVHLEAFLKLRHFLDRNVVG